MMKITPTPLLSVQWEDGDTIWVKDESACPTGTFKDRLPIRLREWLSERGQLTPSTLVTCISMGNTIVSLLEFLSSASPEERVKILGVFPSDFRRRRIGPDTRGRSITGHQLLARLRASGVYVAEFPLESDYLDSLKIRNLAKPMGIAFDYFLDVTYGFGEPMYKFILSEALKKLPSIPDFVLVPVGAGVLFEECVQVVEERDLSTSVLGATTLSPSSIADKLYAYFSPYFQELQENGVYRKKGYRDRHQVLLVDESEVRSAIEILSKLEIDSEPSAAAAFSLLSRLPKGSVTLVINTGNGIPWV